MTVFDLLATTPWLVVGSAFVLSLLVGSFLNVVIHRLPIMLDRQWREQAREMLAEPPVEVTAADAVPGSTIGSAAKPGHSVPEAAAASRQAREPGPATQDRHTHAPNDRQERPSQEQLAASSANVHVAHSGLARRGRATYAHLVDARLSPARNEPSACHPLLYARSANLEQSAHEPDRAHVRDPGKPCLSPYNEILYWPGGITLPSIVLGSVAKFTRIAALWKTVSSTRPSSLR